MKPSLPQRRALLCALAPLLCSLPALALPQDPSAIVQEVWSRYRQGGGVEQESVRLRIEREGQATEQKLLNRWTRFEPQGEKVLVRFAEPSADRGLGLLIVREAGSGSQMWLRMPSWPQGRRIASDRESRYFGGTDLSFEDNRQLLGETLADWRYTLVRSSPDGWVIDAQPREPGLSAYGRRRLSITPAYAISEISYYDPSGELIKIQRHEALSVEPSGRWRANRINVENRREGRRSLFEVEQRRFGVVLPERQWTAAGLVAE